MNHPLIRQVLQLSRRHRPATQGFTLIEMLLAIAISGILMAGVMRVVVSDTRAGVTFAASQGLRNDLGRITGFLETEIGEGDTVAYSQALTGCSTATGGSATGTSLFTINVPYLSGNTRTLSQIHYYADGTNLMRCGPPICSGTATGSCTTTNAGALNTSGSTTSAIVHRNATLTLANATDTEAVTYSLTLTDPGGTRNVSRTGIESVTKVTLIPTS